MTEYKSCRSCVYWDKPREKRALADHAYPCTAPLPTPIYPDSVLLAHGFKLDRKRMERDEGMHCLCWSNTFPRAPNG